jgi:hypothetical protein
LNTTSDPIGINCAAVPNIALALIPIRSERYGYIADVNLVDQMIYVEVTKGLIQRSRARDVATFGAVREAVRSLRADGVA